MLYNSIVDAIGNTPLVRLNRIEKELGLNFKLYAKVEGVNPAGSIKDRVALNMILKAREKGIIKAGATIIEPTSGNTGIGLCLVGNALGYNVILTMPDTMSIERVNLIKAYGAKVILTDGTLGMSGAVKKAEELNRKIPNSWIPSQFDNLDNSNTHYLTTGPEIYRDLKDIDIFVSGIGTGGTITGNAKYLKEVKPTIKVVGFEPETSPLITKGISGKHNLQGIGANFIPDVLEMEYVDEVITISDSDAYKYGKMLVRLEGILAGITSGASISASIKVGEKNPGKNIVCILPDNGDKYLSTELFK